LKAAEQDPAVIALDFQLKGIGGTPGDAPEREADNRHLLDAIRQITARGIPVVLSTGLREVGSDQWQRQANIYNDSELPRGAVVGHINLPKDLRRIAMEVTAWDWNHTKKTDVQSFSIQAVNAYESALGIVPKTVSDKTIEDSARENNWVFGGFLEPDAFPRISAHKLWAGDEDAASRCRHRIVLIGGTWHTQAGPLIDGSPSTFGDVPSVYLHGNYMESLLDNRFKASVPNWLTPLLDLFLAALLYLSFPSVRKTSKRIGVVVAFLLPLTIAYFASANFGLYLDFILPLSLCFIHLAVKMR
jgi:CHASE2 domain-containing sensor protein